MDITINIKLKDILHHFDWDKYCEISGTNPWCMNEGLATGDEIIELTTEQAKEMGIKFPY